MRERPRFTPRAMRAALKATWPMRERHFLDHPIPPNPAAAPGREHGGL
jgi:hypothetical protein